MNSRIIESVAWLVTLLAFISIFAWAGFDVRWWVPIPEGGDGAREGGLIVLHMVALLCAPAISGIRALSTV